jgi:hypothetical protein
MRHSPEQPSFVPDRLESDDLESPKIPEQEKSPEQREIMAEAKKNRAELFRDVLVEKLQELKESPAIKKVLNVLPVIGDAFLITRAARGKEGERRLSKNERATYVLVAACSLTASAFVLGGEHGIGGGLKIFADVVQQMDALPTYLQSAADKAREINPRLAAIFAAAAEFVIAKRPEIQDLKDLFDTAPITLNLRG